MKVELPKHYKKDMKKAYTHFTNEKWSALKPLCQAWQTAWEMSRDVAVSHHHIGYYEPAWYEDGHLVGEWNESDYDEHVGCYSYPNCDIDSNGCCVANGADAEPYGHRD
jgi:hypothetical protein